MIYKYTNTNTQIYKYANTALVKVADTHDMCYIFERVILRGPQKQSSWVSDLQIHKYKYTNTALVKVADRHDMCYILGNDTRTSKTMFYLSGKTNKERENLSQNNLLQKMSPLTWSNA